MFDIVFTTLYVLSVMIHHAIFAIFGFSLLRVFAAKYTPYSAMYLGCVSIIQSLYNGCPVTVINNFFADLAGVERSPNEFWGGIFGVYNIPFRLILLIMGVVFVYYSIKTWKKPKVVVDFRRVFGSAPHSV